MRYLPFTLAMLVMTPVRAAASGAPPVRLSLSDRTLSAGQDERIHVRPATDGYLVVLQTDTQGNVRVLFPVNPTDDDAVRGGHNIEIRGRGDRDAFAASEDPGSGMVLAAWSSSPFIFTEFTTHDRWRGAGILADSGGANPADAMLGIVDRMNTGHYAYDVTAYHVVKPEGWPGYDGWYGPWPDPMYNAWYSPLWDQWYYRPFTTWDWYPYYYQPPVYVPRTGRLAPERLEPRRHGG